MSGCVYCRKGKEWGSKSVRVAVKRTTYGHDPLLRIKPTWDLGKAVSINYCPKCGRDLRGESE